MRAIRRYGAIALTMMLASIILLASPVLVFADEVSQVNAVASATVDDELKYYDSLKEAVAAADDGSTVTVLKSHEIDCSSATKFNGNNNSQKSLINVLGKTVAIDLNGKQLTAEPKDNVTLFLAKEGGHLTLSDNLGGGSVYVNPDSPVYALILCLDSSSSIIVKNGYYRLTSASSSLIYAAANEVITIEGGTFTLDNVGTGPNYSPWVFAVSGSMDKHLVVKGGTFNADVLHQYWKYEVQTPSGQEKNLALHNNGNGTWTMTDSAVYVHEKWGPNESPAGYTSLAQALSSIDWLKDDDLRKHTSYEPLGLYLLDEEHPVKDTLEINNDVSIYVKDLGVTDSNAIICEDDGWGKSGEGQPLFTVAAGKTLIIEDFTPEREGYVFNGWYTDPTFENEFVPSKEEITLGEGQEAETREVFEVSGGTEGISLYAKWGHKVTWMNGDEEFATSVQTEDELLALPVDDPRKDPIEDCFAYEFAGWFTAKEDGERVTADTRFESAADTTYYAQYAKKPNHDTRSYDTEGSVITENCICGHTATAKLSVGDPTYTGEEINPTVEYTENWLGGKLSIQYSGESDRVNVTDKEINASITIGAGVDAETANLSYQISPASIAEAEVSIDDLGSQVYDGAPHTPGVAVTLDGKTLSAADDYDLSHSDNVNAGIASVIVTGKGNYTGSATKPFGIARANAPEIAFPTANNSITYGQTLEDAELSPSKNGLGTFEWTSPKAVPQSSGSYSVDFRPNELALQNYKWEECSNWDADRKTLYATTQVIVERANGVGSVSIDGWTYGDDPKEPVLASETNGASNVTVEYKVKDAEDGTYSSTVPTQAGFYTVRAAFAATDHYTEAVATADFDIAKADYDMSGAEWDYMAPFQYDGKIHKVEIAGLPSGVTASYTGNEAIAVGDYTAKAEFTYDERNYNAPAIGVLGWSIFNDWSPAEYALSEPNANGWLNEDFVINAAEGYMISETNTAEGPWSEALTFGTETENGSATFYLKNIETGAISLGKTVPYKLDKTVPAGEVRFDETSCWGSFLDAITFDLLYKDEVTVKVKDGDNLSGVASVEYLESAEPLSLDALMRMRAAWAPMPAEGAGVPVQDEKRFICYVRITDNAGNVAYLSTDGAEYDTTAPTVSGVANGETYYTTQVVAASDKNVDSITLNGEPAASPITLGGNKEAIYTIEVTDKAGNVTTVVVSMKLVEDIDSATDSITENNVTSDDRDEIQSVIDEIDELLLGDENVTDEEKSVLEQAKANAEALIEKIDEVADATSTESTIRVNSVTAENVSLDDKTDLKKAKADLERALTDYACNYTSEERESVENDLMRINSALSVIEDVEKVEELIENLPDTITKSDEAAVKAAENAYNALSDHGKSLISK